MIEYEKLTIFKKRMKTGGFFIELYIYIIVCGCTVCGMISNLMKMKAHHQPRGQCGQLLSG